MILSEGHVGMHSSSESHNSSKYMPVSCEQN
jgi:hypothetical protein